MEGFRLGMKQIGQNDGFYFQIDLLNRFDDLATLIWKKKEGLEQSSRSVTLEKRYFSSTQVGSYGNTQFGWYGNTQIGWYARSSRNRKNGRSILEIYACGAKEAYAR